MVAWIYAITDDTRLLSRVKPMALSCRLETRYLCAVYLHKTIHISHYLYKLLFCFGDLYCWSWFTYMLVLFKVSCSCWYEISSLSVQFTMHYLIMSASFSVECLMVTMNCVKSVNLSLAAIIKHDLLLTIRGKRFNNKVYSKYRIRRKQRYFSVLTRTEATQEKHWKEVRSLNMCVLMEHEIPRAVDPDLIKMPKLR